MIHAGASGVGTAAIQLAIAVYNAIPIVTVGSEQKVDFVKQKFGVEYAINYKCDDFADRVLMHTNGEIFSIIEMLFNLLTKNDQFS